MIRIVAIAALLATPALAAPCRDAKGHFTKCPTPAAAWPAAVTKDAKGKCHVASGKDKGRYTPCPK